MRALLTGFLVWLLCFFVKAQNQDIQFRDHIYLDNIYSVSFHLQGLFTSYPIFELGSPGVLEFSFDDLEGGAKYYSYTVIHCNADWQPSELEYNEYVYGYEEEEIRNYEYSINTTVNYTHYHQSIPNQDFEFLKSGNYLLVIFENEGNQRVAITRRFMVVEPMLAAIPQMVKPADVSKLKTHQEIDFNLNIQDLRVRNPREEISAFVLQNGRWDSSIGPIRSRFERGDFLTFDYQDKICFPAGKNFRNIDLRSTRFRSEHVFAIERYQDAIVAVADKETPRIYKNYLTDLDVNGGFIVKSTDDRDSNLEGEYIQLRLTLQVNQIFGSDVYVFGAVSDWELTDRFRMQYDDRLEAYTLDVLLKQGFYDYIYVLESQDGLPDEQSLEGDWYEAHNNYTILVYYRPFGERYDRLVCAHTIESAQ
jgi:hypothetical protein